MKRSTVFFLFNFVLLYTSALSQTIRVPLQGPSKPKSNLKKRATRFSSKIGSVPITNLMDVSYFGQVKVGSQKAKFKLVLDTGSSIVWVPESGVREIKAKSTFDCTKSETCKKDESRVIPLNYAVGFATGHPMTDQLDLGGLVISDFAVLLVDGAHGIDLESFDGIMGLALGRHKPEFPTILERLKQDKLISVASFSMYLGNDPDAEERQTGELIFGGYDPKYAKSEFQFVNVRKETETMFWLADLYGVGFGTDVNVSTASKAPVIFDSGTSLMTLPKDVIKKIVSQAGKEGVSCEWDEDQELYECDCKVKDKMKELVFYFDGLNLSIPPSSYLHTEDEDCYLGIQRLQGKVSLQNPIVLGDVFLKNYYTMYNADNYTVGFAKAEPRTPEKKAEKADRTKISGYLWIAIGVAIIVVGLGLYLEKKRKDQRKKMIDNASNYFADLSKHEGVDVIRNEPSQF